MALTLDMRREVSRGRRDTAAQRRNSPVGCRESTRPQWWRGLDSNQRTLARADLQSAAFNHSATSPGADRGAMWRRGIGVSTRSSGRSPRALKLACAPVSNLLADGGLCRPSLSLGRSKIQPSPGWSNFGAGEGNRTLVVSLEGFCSTIELHPLGAGALPFGDRSRQPPER